MVAQFSISFLYNNSKIGDLVTPKLFADQKQYEIRATIDNIPLQNINLDSVSEICTDVISEPFLRFSFLGSATVYVQTTAGQVAIHGLHFQGESAFEGSGLVVPQLESVEISNSTNETLSLLVMTNWKSPVGFTMRLAQIHVDLYFQNIYLGEAVTNGEKDIHKGDNVWVWTTEIQKTRINRPAIRKVLSNFVQVLSQSLSFSLYISLCLVLFLFFFFLARCCCC